MLSTRTRDLAALTFASLFPLAMALLYFVALDNGEARTNPTFIAAFTLGKAIQFLFPVLYVGWFEPAQISWPRPTTRGLLLGAGFGLLVGALTFLLYFSWLRDVSFVMEKTPGMIHHRLQQLGRATPAGYGQMMFFVCVGHSLAEEYYWRWFVFGWLRRHVPIALAIALSGVGFMLHHVVILGVFFPEHFWTLALPFAICVGVGGWFWAWLYQRSHSLYAPWLSHALIDAAIMGVGYVMLERYWS